MHAHSAHDAEVFHKALNEYIEKGCFQLWLALGVLKPGLRQREAAEARREILEAAEAEEEAFSRKLREAEGEAMWLSLPGGQQ